MTRTSSSRWGSQLVMWSSPVLLLVMLFSMTTSARTQGSPHTTVALRASPGPTSSPALSSPTSRTTTTTAPSSRTPTPISTAPPRPSRGAQRSFAATASSESSSGYGVGASVSSGVVAGALAGGQVVDLPLSGPGSWALTASAPVATRLVCPRANTTFADLVVIDSSQTCQLLITSSTPDNTAWRLAPRP